MSRKPTKEVVTFETPTPDLATLKANIEASMLAQDVIKHPQGSGWFQSPNGNWLCTFLEKSEKASFMVLLSPEDGITTIFQIAGGIDANIIHTPTEEDKRRWEDLEAKRQRLAMAVQLLYEHQREPDRHELEIIGRLYLATRLERVEQPSVAPVTDTQGGQG